MRKIALHWQVIIGMVVGAVYAFLSVKLDWNEFTLDYIKPLGDIFISILKMIAVPLVLFSVISGMVSLKDVGKLGRLGIKTLSLYILTTVLAICVGLVCVNILKPGEKVGDEIRKENRIRYELWRDNAGIQKFDDICLSCQEENKTLVEKIGGPQEKIDEWVADKLMTAENQKKIGPLQPIVDVVPNNIFQAFADMEMLQIIFFAIFFGIVVIGLPQEKAEPVTKLIDGLNDIFVQMVMIIMKGMPVFVFALMAGQLVKAAGTDTAKFVQQLDFLAKYSMVLLIGLFTMLLVVYPLFIKLTTNYSPKQFFKGIREAQITAFSTSSSVATLPVTMDCIHNKLKISKSVSSFVLPIGATVNMDGTALYQAVAVVSMAQFHMVDLNLAQQLTIIITATLSSIGAAAIPSAGLVLMIVVLESVGLNPAWIAIIFPVDRILDMFRTVVNVTSDATVAAVISKTEGETI